MRYSVFYDTITCNSVHFPHKCNIMNDTCSNINITCDIQHVISSDNITLTCNSVYKYDIV